MKPPNFNHTVELNGQSVTVRTMQPLDRDMEDNFVQNLSLRSRYLRFHSVLTKLTPVMLEKFTNVDYPDEMALIATIDKAGVEHQIGVARYHRSANPECAEVAIVVADDWQGQGVGTQLLLSLRKTGLEAGIKNFELSVLPENSRMLTLAKKLGFRVQPNHGDFQTIELGKIVDGSNPDEI